MSLFKQVDGHIRLKRIAQEKHLREDGILNK